MFYLDFYLPMLGQKYHVLKKYGTVFQNCLTFPGELEKQVSEFPEIYVNDDIVPKRLAFGIRETWETRGKKRDTVKPGYNELGC